MKRFFKIFHTDFEYILSKRTFPEDAPGTPPRRVSSTSFKTGPAFNGRLVQGSIGRLKHEKWCAGGLQTPPSSARGCSNPPLFLSNLGLELEGHEARTQDSGKYPVRRRIGDAISQHILMKNTRSQSYFFQCWFGWNARVKTTHVAIFLAKNIFLAISNNTLMQM